MASIQKRGTNSYRVQVRRTGYPDLSNTFRTKRDAQNWANEIETEIYRGRHNIQQPILCILFSDFFKQYLDEVTNKRPSKDAQTSERLRLQRFLREEPKLGSYDVSQLQPEHFKDYRDRRLNEPSPRSDRKTIATGTVKRELTTLKRVIDFKKRELGLHLNPVNTDDVKRPAVNDEKHIRLTDEQLKKLFEECYLARNKTLGPIVEFAYETGARRSNLTQLKWTDINLENRTINFRAIKNSRSPEEIRDHETGLSPRAIEILMGMDQSDDRVFPSSPNAVRKAFERAREKAGVSHFNFHGLRHQRISTLIEKGWSTIKVMAQTGHKDVKSLKRYANIQPTYIAEELAKLEPNSFD